ncbi:MAG: anaerobic ribonucleoside-triphosphate reductase activating protein [Holosporales bacterium]|nr:anaerobic ribonucleoside-triphosphate reductase activating protein [Holosporales bacterium]
MQIAGIQAFSVIDYPTMLSAVVFCYGCPLKCNYCHNPDLQKVQPGKITNNELYDFVKKRKNLLDAVVFSGGEPLLQKDLYETAFHMRCMGFKTGLHTSGIDPDALIYALEGIDWIGLDIKTSFHRYEAVTNLKGSGEFALESLKILNDRKSNFEVRTTYDSRTITYDDLFEIAGVLQKLKIERWVIQECILRVSSGITSRYKLTNQKVIDELSQMVKLEFRSM